MGSIYNHEIISLDKENNVQLILFGKVFNGEAELEPAPNITMWRKYTTFINTHLYMFLPKLSQLYKEHVAHLQIQYQSLIYRYVLKVRTTYRCSESAMDEIIRFQSDARLLGKINADKTFEVVQWSNRVVNWLLEVSVGVYHLFSARIKVKVLMTQNTSYLINSQQAHLNIKK